MNLLSFLTPYLGWAKLAGAVLLAGAIAYGGWHARGVADAGPLEDAQIATQKCETARQKDRADANEASARAQDLSRQLASAADQLAEKALAPIKIQSAKILENVNAQPETNSLNRNPALAAYLGGLRGAQAGDPN